MNYRLATLLATEAHAVDKTVPIDIDVKDPISQIIITHEGLSGQQAWADGHPARCITNIELIDGSDVLWSLSGVETQGADFYHNKKEPANNIRYLNGNRSAQIFNMNFGRYLWDPVLAFDPTKFDNPQLKVTIDVDAGGMNVSTGDLTVLAKLFDEKAVTPTGFFMCKEIKNFVLANNTHEYTDLPIDHIYRKLFIRAQRYGNDPTVQVANIKLAEDTDKRVIINHPMDEIIRCLMSETPPYRDHIISTCTTAIYDFYCTPTYKCVFGGSHWRPGAGFGQLSLYSGNGGHYSAVQDGEGGNIQMNVQGWAPHGIIEIPFGLQGDLEDWFDVTGGKVGNLKLDITGGSSVGDGQTCEIFLQQLRSYT